MILPTIWARGMKNNASSPFRFFPFLIVFLHLVLLVVSSKRGWMPPFEFFSILLFVSNCVCAVITINRKVNVTMLSAIMLIIAGHAVIGHRIAPDSLTSGAILMVNILIVYVGFNIYTFLSGAHFAVFAASYLVLFYIFIIQMENAEALFILSLMGLAATARKFSLISYFWALVASFTVFQPYPWQSLAILFLIITVILSVPEEDRSPVFFIFLVCGLALLFFVLFPVFVLVFNEDVRSLINVLKVHDVKMALMRTMVTATLSTIILGVFGIPFSYVLSRVKFKGKTLIMSLMDIPIIIPQSAAGIALLRVFGHNQVVGEFFLRVFGIQFDATMLGILLAQVFVAMPFMIKSAYTAFCGVPPDLERCACTLGATRLSAFRRIALPIAARGICIGAVLAWARAAGEFGAVLFIAPYPQTAPVVVYNRFLSLGIVQTAPLVAALIIFSASLFFLLQISARLLPDIHSREDKA